MSDEYDVVIIGGGSAGIAAARRLATSNVTVLLVEAADHLGGRARTVTHGDIVADLGCGWLHSADRNVWTTIAEANGFTVDRTESAWRSESVGQGMNETDRAAASAAFASWTDRLHRGDFKDDCAAEALEPDGRWNNYIDVLSGFINGTPLSRLSVQDYLAYDDAATDHNWRVRQGYGTLVSASIPETIPSRLSTPVTAIAHDGKSVQLMTLGGTISARTAIVTISTAMLTNGTIRFQPGLDDHLHAADCLPLGIANKLFFEILPGGPFQMETHSLGNPHRLETGSYYVMPLGMPVIECFYGGDAAAAFEEEGETALIDHAGTELAALYGADIRRFVRPLAVSSWANTPWIGGSYSHAMPGDASQRAILAQPVAERLFFAGEATHPTDFSTAHGAYESGLRAAEEALRHLGEIQN